MQLLLINEEFLVDASHQLASITSLPFVHTARRSYRLTGPVSLLDVCDGDVSASLPRAEEMQTLSVRGRRSRNKVSVGEPADGSISTKPRARGGFGSTVLRTTHPTEPPRRGSPRRAAEGNPFHERHLVTTRLGAQAPQAAGSLGVPPDRASARADAATPRTTQVTNHEQFVPTDTSAPVTMKNAAKCDT